jgi:aspergillopepsin I
MARNSANSVMVAFNILVLIIAFANTSFASPLMKKGHSFSVTHELHNRAERMFDGAWALKKAYLRHGIALPEHLHKRQAPEPVINVASVPAVSDNNDLEYLSPVEVGGVKMMLDFDTGSSDL